MADVKPLKLVDIGSGQGQLREMEPSDKLPAELLPATEWTAETVSQAEAEAGTATTRRAWTAERVRQAIAAWWNGATSAFGRGFVAAADAAAGRAALGLGTAATANAQTWPTDTTAGALMAVGAFGLGAETLMYLHSLAHLTTTTAFRWNFQTVGAPFGYGTGLCLRAIGVGEEGGYATAIFQDYVTDDCWIARNTAGIWHPPVRLFHAGNLTPNVLATFTLATLPSAAANPRLQVYCSNLTGQAAPVYSDGTDWRRVSDNTIAN